MISIMLNMEKNAISFFQCYYHYKTTTIFTAVFVGYPSSCPFSSSANKISDTYFKIFLGTRCSLYHGTMAEQRRACIIEKICIKYIRRYTKTVMDRY